MAAMLPTTEISWRFQIQSSAACPSNFKYLVAKQVIFVPNWNMFFCHLSTLGWKWWYHFQQNISRWKKNLLTSKETSTIFCYQLQNIKVRHLTSDIDIALLPRETILFLENLNVSKGWAEHRCWFIVTCPVTKLTNERQSMHCWGKKFSYVANTCIPNLYVKPFFVRE